MVDKFTKWIEAKPIKTAESGPVIDFISGVVHRYGVPHSIITDNGTNFTAEEFKIWCKNMGIKLDYASVTIRLDAQFGTPYPRSAGFDTDRTPELNNSPRNGPESTKTVSVDDR